LRVTTNTNVLQAAERLVKAANTGETCDPIRSLLPKGDLDAAYAVQAIVTQRALESGRRLVGRKIGATAAAMRKQLGVKEPNYGVLFADMARNEDEEISYGDLMQPTIEAEVAFIVGRDLREPQMTMADMVLAIDYAVVSIEICCSRFRNRDFDLVDAIADNACSGLDILGSTPVSLSNFDARLCGVMMERAGEPISVGAGAASMGNPVNAALWLARKMVHVGLPLKQGDVILSGALGPMVPVEPRDSIEVRINGLGSIRAIFSDAALLPQGSSS
jgi:2-keto-4-pentenoate hydratase